MGSTNFKDYYKILGVSKTATAEEIKQAFRRLAREYHPDLNPGNRRAEERLKEINEAHEVLSDPEKRLKYDQYGRFQQRMNQPGPGSGSTESFDNIEFGKYGSFEEFMSQLLGHPGGFTERSEKTLKVTLSLGEAFRGARRRLSLAAETLEVNIPAGVRDEQRLTVQGQKTTYTLVVHLQPHPFFKLEGDNLLCEVPIKPEEAALGTKISVPTLDGPVEVKVPPGVRSGQSLRLGGKGWPRKNSTRGDQLIKVAINVPPTLSPEERQLYEKLGSLGTWDPRQEISRLSI